MKRAVLFLCLVVGLAAAATHAQPTGAGGRQVCAPTNSETTSVAAIAADPGAWMGKCVSVDAIYAGEQLHADADAVYGVSDNSIGGYVDGRGDVGGAWRGTFTGRVADCAQAEEDLLTGLLRSPGISLHGRTLGCPEPRGPFLVFMSQGELKPAGLKRRLPGEKGGNLQRAGAEWKHHATVLGAAREFERAMRSDTPAMLKSLLGNGYVAERLHAGDGSAFAGMKTSSRPQPEIFRDTRIDGSGRFAGEACWCLKDDCTKLWPIHGRDADNQPARPYACLRVEGREANGGVSIRLDASQDLYGLEES